MANVSSGTESDEYEVMSSPASMLSVSLSAPQDTHLLHTSPSTTPPGKKQKSKSAGGKRKGLFRRASKDKSQTKPVTKPVKKLRKFEVNSVPVKEKVELVEKDDKQATPPPDGQPPKPGPKPPKKLSEEELLQQLKQQQSKRVAMARLRKSSKSNEQLHQAAEYLPNYQVDKSYGELDIEAIVSRYGDDLPLKVVVSRGVYGMEEKYSLATSDRCTIHFIKRRELVQIHDPMKNTEFSVPLNTAIKFGVIYNPNDLMSEAIPGLHFKFVSDILAQTKMPKMGMAKLKDPNIIGVVSAELLVIKEVIFPDNPLDPRKLRVYSMTAKCIRDLEETMEINMHTTPSLMQSYLPDILKHVPDPIPLHVAMYRNPLGRPLIAPGIPNTMFRRSMYLKKKFTDILLIATGCSGDQESEDDHQPFEIPMDIDVDFEVIKLSEEEREKLNEESKKLREKLNEKDIRHHRYIGVSEEHHRMQQSLLKSTREGVEPETIQTTENPDDDYVRATSGNRLPMNHRVELLEENIKRCCHSLGDANATLHRLTTENKTLTEKVKCLEETVSLQKEQLQHVASMEQQLDMVYAELGLVRDQLNTLRTVGGDKTTPLETMFKQHREEDACTTNRSLLSTMSQSQVVRMFELAGLGEHTDVVVAEGITGDILIECDEVTLETDMAIKSKTDRLKVLRIIEGKADKELYRLQD